MKKEELAGLYIYGKEKEKKRVYAALEDALLVLYKRYREIIKESLYKGLIGLNMSLYSSKGIGVRYIPHRVYM